MTEADIFDELQKTGFRLCAESPYSDQIAFRLGEEHEEIIYCAGYLFKRQKDGFLQISKKEHHDINEIRQVLTLLGYL